MHKRDVSPPRIIRLTYRSNFGRRRVWSRVVKVPMFELPAIGTLMAGAVQTHAILWFRVERVSKITENMRSGLVRWNDALVDSTSETGVKWD